jgi:hypothetical protein
LKNMHIASLRNCFSRQYRAKRARLGLAKVHFT